MPSDIGLVDIGIVDIGLVDMVKWKWSILGIKIMFWQLIAMHCNCNANLQSAATKSADPMPSDTTELTLQRELALVRDGESKFYNLNHAFLYKINRSWSVEVSVWWWTILHDSSDQNNVLITRGNTGPSSHYKGKVKLDSRSDATKSTDPMPSDATEIAIGFEERRQRRFNIRFDAWLLHLIAFSLINSHQDWVHVHQNVKS